MDSNKTREELNKKVNSANLQANVAVYQSTMVKFALWEDLERKIKTVMRDETSIGPKKLESFASYMKRVEELARGVGLGMDVDRLIHYGEIIDGVNAETLKKIGFNSNSILKDTLK